MHNAYGRGLCLKVDFTDRTPSKKGTFPFKLDVENMVGETIETISNHANCQVMASIRNCRGVDQQDGILIKAQAAGEYTLTGGCVSRFDQGKPVALVMLRAYGVTVIAPQDDYALIIANEKCDISLTNCTFHTTTVDKLSSLLGAVLESPTFLVNGNRTEWNISNDVDAGASNTFTLVHSPRIGQKVKLLMGYTSSNSLATVEMVIPQVGSRTVVAGFHEVDGPALGVLHRISDTQINVSGDVRFRRLQLGEWQ